MATTKKGSREVKLSNKRQSRSSKMFYRPVITTRVCFFNRPGSKPPEISSAAWTRVSFLKTSETRTRMHAFLDRIVRRPLTSEQSSLPESQKSSSQRPSALRPRSRREKSFCAPVPISSAPPDIFDLDSPRTRIYRYLSIYRSRVDLFFVFCRQQVVSSWPY